MLNRRKLLVRTAGFAVFGLSLGKAAAASLPGVEKASMRGSINATELGVQPGTFDDQSKAFAKLLREASDRDMPVFLQPGTYVVSNLTLPGRVRLTGVPGATRIVYGGDGHLFMAEQADHIELSGLVLDGSNRSMGDYAQGLLDLRRVAHLIVDNCQITGSGKNGLALEHAAGRVERTEISGAADAGIYSVEAAGLAITGNTVSDCANGGILVHRWQAAEDGTIVTGNRVERIAARGGGTGQNGNGINAFRAANVIVSGNIVSDCAFSAIRANSASNLQVSGNTCMRSGETAVYSEFSFEGAVISNNIVDGAANGISIVNFNEGGRMGVCSGNIVRNLSTSGPYPADPPGFGVGIGVEADTTVSNNVIENAPLYGMSIGWGPYLRNVVATGNIIRKAGTGIVVSVVDGAGTAIISDNVIDGARNGAIVGQRWADPATGDLAASADTGFPHLTVERNHVS
ncbi:MULTISPECIES: TIGR03808 family TAT-translocated repetitive protein [unclassified Mesorhizobium]|uniref:TIGR03808 family TAT-translocated repetitive protein n=1 Tax=unclassified Mesorhizobium TaxID=325217 RepID=UPI00112BF43A|nr:MULTISPECIES: TIGR03808 family TAT-translocated repetitive protein [unclassified Mesorhizobium]TPJ45292.1 TIGR03808 family TAT-translocated repetitive protein [Mesorhizobium sp. B2-6-6]MBZ9918082.1 TIGR03808 family TAT-translocated repetitive protein [Mesorhizobium sp. BR1-1-7]MBZ9951306.1 TIGR03808 family TAT-translocated repetitive protein [Mesorhizobium sp. BR1-1-15]MBZ9968944.1 TIGR03808 family TAT-translocated repetitive protein [Mesorhizobium sp. BR1-1-12]MCA0001958.1 TIGR03808 family